MSQEMPRNLEEILLWVAHHDGRINAKWEHQEKLNSELFKKLQVVTERVSALERRVVALCCLAAAGGSVLGQQISNLF